MTAQGRMTTLATSIPPQALAIPVPEMPDLDEWMYQLSDEERAAESSCDGYLETVELPPPRIDNVRLAERHVHYLSKLRAAINEVREIAAERRAQVDAWEKRRTARLLRSVAWNEAGLAAYLELTGQKTVEFCNGTVQRRKGVEKVEITDPEVFLAAAPVDLVRTKREPDKRAIMQHYRATGEIVAGVDIYRTEPTLSVTFADSRLTVVDAPAARSDSDDE